MQWRELSRRPEWLVSGCYLLAGVAWILISDKMVGPLAATLGIPPERIQTLKGWLFVSVTTILLHRLIAAWVRRLALSDAKLEAALGAAGLGWWHWDLGTRKFAWSRQFAARYKLTPENTDYQFDALKTGSPSQLREVVEQTARDGDPFFVFDSANLAGQERWLEIRGQAERGPDSRVRTVLGTVLDVTDRYRIEVELAQAQRTLRQLLHHQEQSLEQERRQIAAELHDEVGAGLIAARLDLALLKAQIKTDPRALDQVQEIERLLTTAIETVRNISSQLRPAVLDQLGLGPSLAQLTRDLQRRCPALQVELSNKAEGLNRVSPRQALAAYRIVQEALTNIVRHAQARHVWTSLSNRGDCVVFTVEDDGIGIPPDRLRGVAAFGLDGMRERALAISATLDIEPRSPEGTRVRLAIPLAPDPQRVENA